jgi:phage tail sheath protein FI
MDYKRPGVYTEESLTPLAVAAADPGEAAAAFVGVLPKGPTTPVKVSSWTQFISRFGGFGDGRSYTPFAVYSYFNNGGRAAWIVRAVASDAIAASIILQDRGTTPANTLQVTAISAGAWGDNLSVGVENANTVAGRFDLVVYSGGTAAANIVERWSDVSVDQGDSRYVSAIVNSVVSGSLLIRTKVLQTTIPYVTTQAPNLVANVPLAAGVDGVAVIDLAAATATLADSTQENLVVNLPGITDPTVLSPVLQWAESTGRTFVVVDHPRAADGASSSATKDAYLSQIAGLPVTSYGAAYGPWILTDDPSSLVRGSMRALPPGGAVMGQYSRVDASDGVQKPPAGIDTTIRGALDVGVRFKPDELDSLYAKGSNIIQVIPGAGIVIWGARTLKPGTPDRYISIRRSLIMIKKALIDSTRFAVFQPNNQALWDRLDGVISQYLLTLQQSGVLKGFTPDEAYFVQVDADNNPPSSANAGIVNIKVGVAMSAPAEFVVIQIGQFEGGTSATDSTAITNA